MNNVSRSRMLNGSVYSLKQMCCEGHQAVLLTSFYRKIEMNKSSKIKVKVVTMIEIKISNLGEVANLYLREHNQETTFYEVITLGCLRVFLVPGKIMKNGVKMF